MPEPQPAAGHDPLDAFDLRRELLAAFEGEYREHLTAMRAVLDAGTVSGAGLRDVFRRAHSLKGAARAVDLPRIEQIAHELETLLFASVETARALPPEHVAEVRRGLDSIEEGMRGEPEPAAARSEPPPLPETGAEPRATAVAPAEAASRVSSAEIERLVDSVQAASEAMLGEGQARAWLVEHRVALNRLLGLCGAVEGAGAALAELRAGLKAATRSVEARLRDRRHDDWTREQTVAALRAQVERVALVSADSVFGPLAAMARALGREQGQEIDVRFEGMSLRADRPVLQALRDPVIHLLRNAVGHGLSGRGERAGDQAPSVCLLVRIQAGRLVVEVADNGGGPDLEAITSRARQQGLLSAGAAAGEAELMRLVFEPGFSTSKEVDRLSGRGMGLSIVAEAAARLGGVASMAAVRAPGGGIRGTLLRMEVPLAARRQTLLLMEAGGHLVALPSDAVARLRSAPWPAIRRDEAGWTARIDADRSVPVRPLAGLLGLPVTTGTEGEKKAELVMLRDGDAEIALVVEGLHSVVTLVVRPPAIVGIDRRLVGGVTMLEDHRPVLVLEPDGLRRAWFENRPGAGGPLPGDQSGPRKPGPARKRRPTILVVDDSITTRTLEKTILQAQGFAVLVAVDGLEALDVLRGAETEIDVVVADVEMPRLDGFGLVAAMQADPGLKRVPVVLMTSRDDPADIARGLELGASAYLTKQEFEQGVLLSVIGQLLP